MNWARAFAGSGLVVGLLCVRGVEAQVKKPGPTKTPVNPAAVRALDKEADQLQKDFIDSLENVANRYEEAGDVDKAQATLARVLELDPQREKVKERLDVMRSRVFEDNEVEVEIDVTKSWTTAGVSLKKDEVVRIAADGSYKLILNATATAAGLPTEDVNRDLVSGVSLGQLMGIVFPPPQGRQKPKPGKPFAIGQELEFTPSDSGMLFLRLNVPAGTKSVGTVKVKISGNFER